MNRVYLYVVLLVVFSHVQLEFSTWYYELFGSKIIHPIINNSEAPEWYLKSGVKIEWWIKYVSDDFLMMVSYFVLALVARQFSYRLYLVGILFLGYHVFDHFMLWYNYKTSWWLYIVELAVDISAVIVLFKVKEKKQAVVKSLI